MKLSDLLDDHAITTSLRERDQKGALAEIVNILERTGKITDSGKILKALLDREAAGSTASGKGLAFPHARIDGLREPVAVLAISEAGIHFPDRNGRDVYLIFLFLTPAEQTELHLQILSKAAGVFSETGLYHSLRKARSPHTVLQILLNHEKGGKEVFFPLSLDEIFTELRTGMQGLADDEAAKRLERYGPNVLREVSRKSLFWRFVENLTNLFAILLWIGGILSLLADMAEMAVAIFIVIIVNALFSFWQEFKAERALEALKKLIPKKARVMRNGGQREVPAEELVPGDIILLEEGDSISADARLVEAAALRIDNSALTGESRPIHKTAEAITDGKEFLWTEIPNLVFAGTAVSSGSGKAAVIATGMHSEIGRIASLTQELEDEKSPLQREIEAITKVITAIAVAMGIIFFFVGMFLGKLTLAAAFLFTIGIIAANVPEGLMPTVTLSLALAVQRMARRNVLIKRLSSVETLGSTTVICTDKTGTLTTGEIAVTQIFINKKLITVGGNAYDPTGVFRYQGVALSHEEMDRIGLYPLFDASLLCNNAALHPPRKKGEPWSMTGDPTEGALLVMASKAGFDISARVSALPRIGHLPFEAVRKRMTCVNLMDGEPVASVKGAPVETLELCEYVLSDGAVQRLTDDDRIEILRANDSMAKEGLRVLAVATRRLEFSDGFTVENTERQLVFLGLAGMMDPPRPEVPAAITLCKRAGIRVIMVTGDYGLTAVAIGRKIGLTRTENPQVITGRELPDIDDESLKMLLREEPIFARTTPEHKMRIVTALKAAGEIVAVTGDGVNDAPALKKADIGVAMGGRGSDVAKEAASMILADDNFASIVSGIEEGRTVYANIRKFVTYIFTHLVAEMVPFIAFVLFRIPLPLTVMQILAIDLGTDLLPALALGSESPEPGIMDRPPRPRTRRLLDQGLLLRAYCFLGPLEAATSMSAFFFLYWQAGWKPGLPMADSGVLYVTATTMTFAAIVATQMGNVLACRTERESVLRIGLFSNRLVIAAILAELVIVLLLIYTPFLQAVFGLAPLSLRELIFLGAFIPLPLIFDEARKYIIRASPPEKCSPR